MNLHVLHGTCVYIKSYEAECTVVIPSIRANELAAHETHIGLEGKVFGCLAIDGVGAHASDCSPTHEAVEIGDRGRLDARSWEEYMEERSVRAQQLEAAGNGKRCGSRGAVVAVSFECGSACQFRQNARGGESAQRNARFFEEASTVQQSLCEVAMTWICRSSSYVGN
jgi:hypothetical protein